MPVLQPISWNSRRKDEFRNFLQFELSNTIGDRAELERKWENWIIQHRAALPGGTKDFPYVGASDIEVPLTDIHYQPVYADFMQTLHAPEDYWTVTARRADRVDHANAVRRGLTAVEKHFIKMRRVNMRRFIDQILLGTAVVKNRWHAERKSVRRYTPDGSIEKALHRVSQPRIEHVPLQRFYFPADAWSIDPDAPGGARWLAQEFFVTPSQLRVWANGADQLPGFDRDALARVIRFVEDKERPVDQVVHEEQGFKPFQDQKIRVFEVWARFDVDGDGVDEDVTAIFHLESLEILRSLHNPFFHGKWPFHVTQFLPSFGILGIGLAELDEWAQETATKLLNAQIDNVLLANTRMFAAPLGSNIQPNEPIYPGKVWLLGPDERIQEIRLSEVYPSLPTVFHQILQIAEMRTAVSEIRQGNLQGLPSRTPATSLLSILREGNKRFDMILTNVRDTDSEIGLRVLQNLAQHFPDDQERWIAFFMQALGERDAQLFLEVLASSVADIEESFGVSVTATSAQVNKEVEKQAFIGLLQIVGQVGAQLVQVAQLAQSSQPGTPIYETSVALYSGGVELLKQLLARFDIQNPSEYLGNMEAIANALLAQAQGGNAATAALAGPLGVLGPASGVPPQILGPSQIGGLFGL